AQPFPQGDNARRAARDRGQDRALREPGRAGALQSPGHGLYRGSRGAARPIIRGGCMKLVLFQAGGTGEITPGLLTDRGVVSIAKYAKKSYTPQLTMNGIIDDYEKLKPALERAAASDEAVPLSSVQLRSPLPRPGKILACIANYW